VAKRIAVLVAIPLVLAALGFAGQTVMEHSWDELVAYESQYTGALPAGQGGEALTDQVVIVLQDGLRVDTSTDLEAWNELRAEGADLNVRVRQPSLSIPSFSVINTGAYQEMSGVTTNWYEGPIPPVDSIYCAAQAEGAASAAFLPRELHSRDAIFRWLGDLPGRTARVQRDAAHLRFS